MKQKALKRWIGVVLGLVMACALCSGCGSDAQEEADAAQQAVSDAVTEASDEVTDVSDAVSEETDTDDAAILEELLSACTYVTADMYERATSYSGMDATRVAAVLRKADAGEAITIGVIGGSITQGSSASSTANCYASLLKAWFEETFPQAEITFINAGIGSTTSYLGVHRIQEDLLDYEPDLVVVEFSVNDSNTNFYKKTYDNLLRKILLQENNPAVMLLFMTQQDGTSATGNDSLVGFAYSLPMISYRNAVLTEIENGTFTWSDIAADTIHPANMGHKIVAELLTTYLGEVYAHLDAYDTEIEAFSTAAVTKEVYLEATILDGDDITPDDYGTFAEASVNTNFPNGWQCTEGEGGIVFTVEARNIGILYQMTIDGLSGQFEVYIDGVCVTTLDADYSGGWGAYPESTEVYTSDEKATHTIEIRKSENSTGDVFSLLGLLIS